jgi:hypothetical protein
MLTNWTKSVEGQWSSAHEEWESEREQLTSAREEWESKARAVEVTLGNTAAKFEFGCVAETAAAVGRGVGTWDTLQ